MTQYATLNGSRVVSARITIPKQGVWVADVVLAESTALSSASVTLTVGDLALVGTVVRSASFAGSLSTRIVGGGAGWRKTLKPKGYNNPTGVKLKSILEDAARESGEVMFPFTDKVIGSHYTRERKPAENVLRIMAPNWWIDNDGKTHIEPRTSSRITSVFTVEHWSGGKGSFEISTEVIKDWVPGRTFSTATVPTEQEISCVSIETDNEGKLRLYVLTGPATTNRLIDDMRSLVKDELSKLTLMGAWEYKVVKATESAIDAQPIDINSPLPQVSNVKPLFGVMLATPEVGERIALVFLDGNPTKPRWLAPLAATKLRLEAGGAANEHLMTLEATVVLLHNFAFALGLLGLPPAWLASGAIIGALNAALAASAVPAPPTEAAQVLAAPGIASAMASAPGNVTTPYDGAIALAATKVSNESGFFPQLGCSKVQGG